MEEEEVWFLKFSLFLNTRQQSRQTHSGCLIFQGCWHEGGLFIILLVLFDINSFENIVLLKIIMESYFIL